MQSFFERITGSSLAIARRFLVRGGVSNDAETSKRFGFTGVNRFFGKSILLADCVRLKQFIWAMKHIDKS